MMTATKRSPTPASLSEIKPSTEVSNRVLDWRIFWIIRSSVNLAFTSLMMSWLVNTGLTGAAVLSTPNGAHAKCLPPGFVQVGFPSCEQVAAWICRLIGSERRFTRPNDCRNQEDSVH